MTTIGITSFYREPLTKRLVESIRKFYPDIKIMVCDDSDTEFDWAFDLRVVDYHLPFDSGLSAKRNFLVNKCETEFIYLLDNDYIFTYETDIGRAEELISDYDILGLATKEHGTELIYKGKFITQDSEVTYIRSDTEYHFVGNHFLARTDSLRLYPWDTELKMGEHFAYFYEYKDKLKIGYTHEVSAEHQHGEVNESYPMFRDRAEMYVKKYMQKKGLTKRIDLSGNVITV
jgi:hypothetical protein